MRRLALLSLCIAILATPAAAQARSPRVRLVGLTLDHWRGSSGPALLRPTLRLTSWRSRGPGVDLAVVMLPDGISFYPPALAVGLQAGLVQPVRAGPVVLLPRVGGAGVAILGLLADNGLFRLVPGVQAGLGVLVPVDRKSTVRLDVTRHLYSWDVYRRSALSLGFGFAGGMRRSE